MALPAQCCLQHHILFVVSHVIFLDKRISICQLLSSLSHELPSSIIMTWLILLSSPFPSSQWRWCWANGPGEAPGLMPREGSPDDASSPRGGGSAAVMRRPGRRVHRGQQGTVRHALPGPCSEACRRHAPEACRRPAFLHSWSPSPYLDVANMILPCCGHDFVVLQPWFGTFRPV